MRRGFVMVFSAANVCTGIYGWFVNAFFHRMSFVSIALHHVQILAIYFVGIMVVLPVVVATWWWNSKKYTRDRLLRQTVNLYYQYLRMQMPMRGR